MTYNGNDQIAAKWFQIHEVAIGNYNLLTAQLSSATADMATAIASWMENPTSEEGSVIVRQINSLSKRLEGLAQKEVESNRKSLSDEEKVKIGKEIAELTEKIRTGETSIKYYLSVTSDPEGVEEYLNSLGNPTIKGRGRPKGSQGSSIPRVSCIVSLRSSAAPSDSEDETYETMSKAATRLGMELPEFQKAFCAAAGVEYEDISTVKIPISFDVIPPGSTTTWRVKTAPKERAARGSSKIAA